MWKLAIIALVLHVAENVTSLPYDVIRVKRADDTAPLETVVSQLSNKVDTLISQVNQLQAENGEL